LLARAVDIYSKVIVGAMTALVMALTIVVSYQVFSRYADFVPRFIWTEEASRFCFIWVVMLGAAIAVREGSHFTIDVLPQSMPEWLSRFVVILGLLTIAVIGGLMVLGGLRFVEVGLDRISTTSGIRLAWVYAALPVSGISILVFTIEKLVWAVRGRQTRLGSRSGTEEF
jgi:TRAP-type C4-dicarboxylate transport system permease small subunit